RRPGAPRHRRRTLPQELCRPTVIQIAMPLAGMTQSHSMKTSLPVLLAALSAVLTACSDGVAEPPPQPQSNAAVQTRAPSAGVAAALPDFSSLVEQYGAAVVNVEVVQKMRQTRGPGGQSEDPLLDFFRRFGIPPPGGGGPGGPGGEGDGMP